MFKKKQEEASDLPCYCRFCEKASLIHDDDNVLCRDKGIVNKEFTCKHFVYDPLKREPKPMPPLPKLSEEDLVL